MMMMIYFNSYFLVLLLALLCSIQSAHSGSSNFAVRIDTDGSYQLSVRNLTWLSSAETQLRANGKTYDAFNETLKLVSVSSSSGGATDRLGPYQSTELSYQADDDPSAVMNCSIMSYEQSSLVRFRQHFPNGAKQTSYPIYSWVSSVFPSFRVEKIRRLKIGYLSFGGMMAGDMEKIYGTWNAFTTRINDGMAGGPLVLFNPQNGDTLVVSSMSEFMAASSRHTWYRGKSLQYGIMSGVDEIPKDYSIDFSVYYSANGINKAMEEWGALLIKYYNKNVMVNQVNNKQQPKRKEDVTRDYLSYWMDNGAYYYWITEQNKTYQQTILDIVADAEHRQIPYKSLQYDSWWYGAEKASKQGCFKWDGNVPSERFPGTLRSVYDATGMPITAHNKFWDYSVVYAKENGGSYNFILDNFTKKALPCDDHFWDDLFRNGSAWGLKTYEQDWMNHQVLDYTPLMTNITLGRTWLRQMADAADRNNMTVQYCMSLSREVLASVEHDAVTQIRVTNDYATNHQYGGQQWRVGVASMFSAAVGLAPFKDVYWTVGTQPGNPYSEHMIDDFVELNSVVSLLTAGPVGPGDKLNYTNRDLLMRSCAADGLLLRPSRPVTGIDQMIWAKAMGEKYGPDGEAWSTYSQIGEFTFGTLFAADLHNSFSVSPKNAPFAFKDGSSVFWQDGQNDAINPFDNQNPIQLNKTCTMKKFCLINVAPTINLNNQMVSIIGEQAKWVPMSVQRFSDIAVSSDSIVISASGSVDEELEFTVAVNFRVVRDLCVFQSSRMTITVRARADGSHSIHCSA